MARLVRTERRADLALDAEPQIVPAQAHQRMLLADGPPQGLPPGTIVDTVNRVIQLPPGPPGPPGIAGGGVGG